MRPWPKSWFLFLDRRAGKGTRYTKLDDTPIEMTQDRGTMAVQYVGHLLLRLILAPYTLECRCEAN